MKQDRTWRKTVGRWLTYLVGNALDAMAVAVFTLPFNIIIGGVSGIDRVANAVWDLPISVVEAVINATLLVVSFFLMGRAFASTNPGRIRPRQVLPPQIEKPLFFQKKRSFSLFDACLRRRSGSHRR